MELSTASEESFTERNSSNIFYAGKEDCVVELASIDIVASLTTVAVTLYFENDIKGESPNWCLQRLTTFHLLGDTIMQALLKASEEHYELFGRIIPHPTQCFQLKVDSEGWFPFTEQRCNLTVHEALAKYGQIQAIPSEDGKRTQAKLVFSAHVDIPQSEKEKEPLFQSKLTHFVDGYCALGFAFSHSLMDGQRFVDLLVDIGKAARGLHIEPKMHDRTVMWPDVFLKKIQVPDMDPAKFPRIGSPEFASFDLSPLTRKTESLYSLLLHFPDELIQQLKQTLSGHLSHGEYLSTVDIVTALMWLALCEADVADSDEKTLPERFKESVAFQCLEGHKNGASWVPSNYSGNAMFSLSLKYQENETYPERDSLIAMLLNAALTVRREILGVRGNQAKLAEHLSQRYHLLNDVTLFQQLGSPFIVMFMSSLSKLGFEDIDFGAGKPCFIDCPCETPISTKLFFIVPGLKSGGVFVSSHAGKSKQNSLFNSHVLRECAPGVNFVFGRDPAKPEFNLQL